MSEYVSGARGDCNVTSHRVTAGAAVCLPQGKPGDSGEEVRMTTELVLLGTAGAPMPVVGRGAFRPH